MTATVMKKIFVSLTFLILVSAIFGQTSFTNDGIVYTSTSSNTVQLSYGVNSLGEIVIPSDVSYLGLSYNVTSIGSGAFINMINISSVIIPNSVTAIESMAFMGCTGLTSLILPPSLITIGGNSFYGCSSLTSIIIPSTVLTIEPMAFLEFSGFINVDISNKKYSSKDGVLYNKDFSFLIQCPTSIKDNFIVPSSVLIIGDNAFRNCVFLSTIEIPSSVAKIESNYGGIFSGCSGLFNVDSNNQNYSSKDGVIYNKNFSTILRCPTSFKDGFTIPSSVNFIENNAFFACKDLSSISIPSSVTSIGIYSFLGCTGLSSVTIPNSVKTIGSGAFTDCTGLTTISIPSSVTTISENAFRDCKSLTSITIPSSVTKIKNETFSGCTSLRTITIPSSVTSIEGYAFQGCTSVQTISIPSSVSSISNDAFRNFSGFFEVDINNDFYSSKDGVLYNKDFTTLLQCPITLKKGFSIPPTVSLIENNAFSGCIELLSITIPSSVTFIKSGAFSGGAFSDFIGHINVDSQNLYYSSKDGILFNKDFTKLIQCPITLDDQYIIPTSVTSIGNGAFSNCSRLVTMKIPSSVTSIGIGAFSGCKGLTNITLSPSITRINDDTFYECSSLVSIIIPANVTSIGDCAFYDCTRLSTLSIPSSLTYIGISALSSCTGLTSIYLNGLAPPYLVNDEFRFVDVSNCKLYVPFGTLSTYKTAIGWQVFQNIIEFEPTGIDIPQSSKIRIYPNPSSSLINVERCNDFESQDLKIFDSKGQLVFNFGYSEKQIQIDVSGFSSGIYFIQTTDKNSDKRLFGRFFKQ